MHAHNTQTHINDENKKQSGHTCTSLFLHFGEIANQYFLLCVLDENEIVLAQLR